MTDSNEVVERILRGESPDSAVRMVAEEISGRYICRYLTNGDDLVRWAEEVGLPTLDHSLHVTIAHSKADFPHIVENGGLQVRVKGIQLLGTENAVVLTLDSDHLQQRWQALRDAGATWDFDGYNPHMTLYYLGEDVPEDHVLPAIPEFDLWFGPEVSALKYRGTDEA